MTKFLFFRQPADNRGQIAVIILLIMAVLLVIGISLASRTSEEIMLSTQQQDTARVFNAAETGIEAALSNPELLSGEISSGTTEVDNIEVQYSRLDSADFEEVTLNAGETITYFSPGATSTIRWRGDSCAEHASLILTAYYTDLGGTVRAVHDAVRPDCNPDADTFTGATRDGDNAGVGTVEFDFDIPAGTRHFIRITPLYHSTTIVEVTGVLDETTTIRSEASREVSGGSTEFRAIEVTRTNPAPPSIFDYALYSGGTLTK